MTKTLEFIKCPLCKKCSPVSHASFNKGGSIDLGEIQVRWCQGKRGFPLVKKIPLRNAVETHPVLAKDILDACSRILISVMKKPVPVDKPEILRIIKEMENTIEMQDKLLKKKGFSFSRR